MPPKRCPCCLWLSQSLELHVQPHLQLPTRAANTDEAAVPTVPLGYSEFRRIGDVEEARAKLDVAFLAEVELLVGRRVNGCRTRTLADVPRGSAEHADARSREGAGVEPLR